MEPLTPKQRKILKFIERRLRAGDPPSQRQIAHHFGLAQNAVYQLISYLKKKGYLTDSGGHRGLRLSRQYADQISQQEALPIIGRVAAGQPILAEQNIEGYMDFDTLFKKSDDVFALRVAGDSMADEGIMDGDYVVVRQGPTIDNGQIAVVLLGDEATVKRLYIQKNKIALKPANRRARYKTRYVRRTDPDLRIVGKVIGCIRTNIR